MIIRVKLCFLFAAGIEPKGCRLTLKITDPEDLNRDVLKVQFYSLKTFCLGWLVLVFSRGDPSRTCIPLHFVRARYRKRHRKQRFAKHVNFPPFSSDLSKQLSWRNLVLRACRLPSLFLAIACTIDVIVPDNANVFHICHRQLVKKNWLGGGFEPVRNGEIFLCE